MIHPPVRIDWQEVSTYCDQLDVAETRRFSENDKKDWAARLSKLQNLPRKNITDMAEMAVIRIWLADPKNPTATAEAIRFFVNSATAIMVRWTGAKPEDAFKTLMDYYGLVGSSSPEAVITTLQIENTDLKTKCRDSNLEAGQWVTKYEEACITVEAMQTELMDLKPRLANAEAELVKVPQVMTATAEALLRAEIEGLKKERDRYKNLAESAVKVSTTIQTSDTSRLTRDIADLLEKGMEDILKADPAIARSYVIPMLKGEIENLTFDSPKK